jgi:uncharacterized protein YjhX (UPF0386 family)
LSQGGDRSFLKEESRKIFFVECERNMNGFVGVDFDFSVRRPLSYKVEEVLGIDNAKFI